MSTINTISLNQTSSSILERLNYFPRQLMTADDMRIEQEYFLERMRRHNRLFHGWGILRGLSVDINENDIWKIYISEGVAVDFSGNEIIVPSEKWIDLSNQCINQDIEPCVPCLRSGTAKSVVKTLQTYYLCIHHHECRALPVRIMPEMCGSDEGGCEYSRIRESFKFVLLDSLPNCYRFNLEMKLLAQQPPLITTASSAPVPVAIAQLEIGEKGVSINSEWSKNLGSGWNSVNR